MIWVFPVLVLRSGRRGLAALLTLPPFALALYVAWLVVATNPQ